MAGKRRAEASQGRDLRRRLEARAEKSGVDALLQLDVLLLRHVCRKLAQVGRVGVRHAHERGVHARKVLVLDEGVGAP